MSYEAILECYWRTDAALVGKHSCQNHRTRKLCWKRYEVNTLKGDLMNRKQWAHARRRDRIKRQKMRRKGVIPPKAQHAD